MDENPFQLISTKTTVFNSNEFDLPVCDKGDRCNEIDFNHFTKFYHDSIKKDISEKNDILNETVLLDKYSLRRSFSEMSDNEKRFIVEKSENWLTQLRETQKLYIDKCISYDRLFLNFEEISLVHGEKQALDSRILKFIRLDPRNKLEEDHIADDYHFRLAESQFYRLIYGSENNIFNASQLTYYKVIYINYVVNYDLSEKFNNYKTSLPLKRGKEYCKTVLGFHGTDESNIESICKRGFLDPTHPDFQQSTDSGYYGRGIYFSQNPLYAMQYIRGCKSLLLCQIALGRVFCCNVVNHGQNCETGYDSHCSPNANELVVFCSDQILPKYVVHFETIDNEIDVTQSPPNLVKYNSKFETEINKNLNERRKETEKRKIVEMDTENFINSAKKLKTSKILENVYIYADSPTWSKNAREQIESILKSHGAICDNSNFSIFVTDENNVRNLGESFRISLEKNIPCILFHSLLKILNEGKPIKENISKYIINVCDI